MNAGEYRDTVEIRAQILLGHRLQLAAVDGPVGCARDAQPLCDRQSGRLVVARDHHRTDACALALGNRRLHFFARGVDLADQAEQGRTPAKLAEVRRLVERAILDLRKGEHA